jgi:hypothetical protein
MPASLTAHADDAVSPLVMAGRPFERELGEINGKNEISMVK